MTDSDIRLIVDEHIPKDVINRLRIWDVDVEAVKDIEMRGATDEEILEIAKDEGDILPHGRAVGLPDWKSKVYNSSVLSA